MNAATTTTIPAIRLPQTAELPPGTTTVLNVSGTGSRTFPVDMPKGTYAFQIVCTHPANLNVEHVTLEAPCEPGGLITFTCHPEPLHDLTIDTTTSWQLYVGRET